MMVSITLGYKGFDAIPEAPYAYTAYVFMITVTVLILCGDLGLTLICAVAHTMIFLTKFRTKFIMIIQEEDPEAIVNLFIVAQLIYGKLHKKKPSFSVQNFLILQTKKT